MAPATPSDAERVDPNALTPHPRNSRRHPRDQIMRLIESISEFGVVKPLVVDEDHVVLAGHGIREAAIEMGLDEVPIVIARGLTDEQKRAYVIADNRLGELSKWDHELVALELQELPELQTMDLPGLFARKDGAPRNQTIGGDRFLLQVEVDSEEALEALFNEMNERGVECKILS